MGKEAYAVNFHLVIAITTLSDGCSTSKDRSTHERSPEDRLLSTSYWLRDLCSAPSLEKKQQKKVFVECLVYNDTR